ncbi:hypothetical protein EDB83DRAFT_2532164 [Lactarius deliciosus]|nr:hypothetical protein EDB83DRAFT_2532164 [Lactarius deliciosus]
MSLTALVWASSSMTPSQYMPATPHPSSLYRRHFKSVPATFFLRHAGVHRRYHLVTAHKTRHNATPLDAITTWRSTLTATERLRPRKRQHRAQSDKDEDDDNAMTAFPIDLEMDADLQERVEALDEGDGTDNSDDDEDESDFFS